MTFSLINEQKKTYMYRNTHEYINKIFPHIEKQFINPKIQ